MVYYMSSLVFAVLATVAVLASAQTSYNSETQICCNGTLSERDNERSLCCGSEPYDYETSICCMHNQIVEHPSINDSNSYGCCYDEATKTSTLFNYRTQECCNGEPILKPDPDSYYGCCNRQLFNWTTQVCCDGAVQELEEGAQCCGNKDMYYSASQLCCQKYGYTDEGTYELLDYAIVENTNSNTECCDLKTYDTTTHACCEGEIKPKKGDVGKPGWGMCCGGEPYDRETETCCSVWGEIAPNQYGVTDFKLHTTVEGTSPACCGLELYDDKEEICCDDNTLIPKPEGSNKDVWMSCCDGQAITNHTTQFCYNNKLFTREDYNFYACGEKMFDYRQEFCCGEVIYSSDSTMACCYGANEAYDTTTHMCCFDKIEPLSDKDLEDDKDACCAVEYNRYQMMPAGR